MAAVTVTTVVVQQVQRIHILAEAPQEITHKVDTLHTIIKIIVHKVQAEQELTFMDIGVQMVDLA